MKKIKALTQKLNTKMVVGSATALSIASPCFAADVDGTDLGTIADAMTGFLTSLKTYGVAIVIAVIAFALIFVGARWLWGMFRQWLASAK